MKSFVSYVLHYWKPHVFTLNLAEKQYRYQFLRGKWSWTRVR